MIVNHVCAFAECYRSFNTLYQLFLYISCADKREVPFVFVAQ